MSIVVIGSSGAKAEVDGVTYRALNVTARPVDFGLVGEYAFLTDNIGGSGTLGSPGSAGVFFSVQWTDPMIIALVWHVQLNNFDLMSGTPDAAAFQRIGLYANRQYTVPAGTAGTIVTLDGSQLRTSMSSSLIPTGGLVLTTANATATPGTSFVDDQPIGQVVFSTPGAVAQTSNRMLAKPLDLYGSLEMKSNNAPLVLAENEGFTVQSPLSNLTSVLIYCSYKFEWSEVAFY